jgi:hypothetical protein
MRAQLHHQSPGTKSDLAVAASRSMFAQSDRS